MQIAITINLSQAEEAEIAAILGCDVTALNGDLMLVH